LIVLIYSLPAVLALLIVWSSDVGASLLIQLPSKLLLEPSIKLDCKEIKR
jgi:hypothetical protein